MGDGWEPHVDERDGVLYYSAPVDSSYVSRSFTFTITESDLAVLLSDGYRRAALEVIGHAVLQRSTLQAYEAVTKEQFAELVGALLHTESSELEATIARYSAEYNLGARAYIADFVQRRENGGS